MYINNKSMNCYIALLGISIGELSNIIFMLICLWRDSSFDNRYIISIKDFYNSSMETLKMSIPITCNRMSNILLQSISSMMIPSRLALSGMTYQQSLSMYGIVSGMVMPFIFYLYCWFSAYCKFNTNYFTGNGSKKAQKCN